MIIEELDDSTTLLSDSPTHRMRAVELLEHYLRLPDAWPQGVPDQLPTIFRRQLAAFPGPATPPTGDVVLAMVASRVVGQVLVVLHDVGVARLERMYVIEPFQRQGIGTRLVQRAMQEAQRLGYRRVVLDVIADRATALKLYEHAGFEPIEPYADYRRPMVFLGRAL